MVQQEHRIYYNGREATPEPLQNNAPHRGLGIAELEKVRGEEQQKMFSRRTELVFHPLCPHPNTTFPYIPGFDPSSPFGYHVENLPMSRSPHPSPPVSGDGTMPLLWSSFQGDTSPSCSFQGDTLLLPLPLPLQQHDLQQQISQVMNHSSLHSIPETGLQLELELHNVGVNHNSSLFTVKRNRASEEDVAAPIDGSILSLGCLPSVWSSTWSQKTMPMQPVTKRQKTEEDPVGKASATPSEALVFYNFMELPYSDYIAERDAVANKKSWEGSDAVCVDLKL